MVRPLNLSRNDLAKLLRANDWSITRAARAESHDRESFRRLVVRQGFDLKKLARAARQAGWRKRRSELYHGMSHTPEHTSWSLMKSRCHTSTHPDFKDYGGRGIEVFPLWQKSFAAFFEYMGSRPPNTSIDRIDNSKGYVPGNVRWATPKQQGRNKRNNRMLTFKGRTQTMSAWAEEFGVSGALIYHRLRRGLSIEQALTQPKLKGKSWEQLLGRRKT